MTIHEELKAARISQGLSMEALAQKISDAEQGPKPLAWQTIQQWEAGKSAPKRTRLELVKRILGIGTAMTQNHGNLVQETVPNYLSLSTAKFPSAYTAVMEMASLINAADKSVRIAIGGLLQHLCENPEDAEITARRINALLEIRETTELQRSTR